MQPTEDHPARWNDRLWEQAQAARQQDLQQKSSNYHQMHEHSRERALRWTDRRAFPIGHGSSQRGLEEVRLNLQGKRICKGWIETQQLPEREFWTHEVKKPLVDPRFMPTSGPKPATRICRAEFLAELAKLDNDDKECGSPQQAVVVKKKESAELWRRFRAR